MSASVVSDKFIYVFFETLATFACKLTITCLCQPQAELLPNFLFTLAVGVAFMVFFYGWEDVSRAVTNTCGVVDSDLRKLKITGKSSSIFKFGVGSLQETRHTVLIIRALRWLFMFRIPVMAFVKVPASKNL